VDIKQFLLAIKQIAEEKKFTLSEVNISIEKFLVETRNLINQGVIKLDRIDPELEVPTDIEEKLNAAQLIKSVNDNSTFNSSSFPPYMPPENKSESKEELPKNKRDSQAIVRSFATNEFKIGEGESISENFPRDQKKSENKNESSLQVELNKMREKMQLLRQENHVLKGENDVLKDKLDRIKRIA
jgi:hypothetical protein